MKKRLIVILSLIVALLPANGQLAIVNDSTMFISQQVDSLTEAERYFNPLFLVVAKGKEHLKQQLVRGSICDCDTTLPNRHIGVFSVAPNKHVTFSQGNLQFFPAANIYKFADNQYDILGNANKYFSPAFRNWVDLFEWSSTSTGDFVDWGTNWICGDKPDTWRTLSKDEWDYLLYLRPNADNLRTKATVDGIGGMILLPDNWNTSTNYSLQKVKDNETLLPNVNMFTPAEWVILEEAGVVFLPAAGRSRTYLPEIKNNIFGGYWSSTPKTTNQSYCYSFHVQQMDSYTNFSNCSFGRSVRLVKDTIVEKPEYIQPPKRIGIFSVAADKQVSFSQGNLQYIQSTDTWQFANNQLKYMGYNHYRNGQLADTIEYFGWSAKNSKAPWGISLSTELADYEGEFLDWGTNIIAGDTANTWRTLSNDEWNYICKGRKNAANLLGLGKIDTTSGLIILPDDWVAPDGIIFTPNTDNPDANPYNLQQWTAMENAGAVFIPPTGYFNHKMDNMRGVHQYGYYRNSTLNQYGRQIYTFFTIRDALPNDLTGYIQYSCSGNNQGNLFYAFPVRLVHDTIVPQTIPEPCLIVKVNDTLSINMMCVEGGTFTMGDGDNAHPVTLSSYSIGQTEVTQALWEAVMGTNPSANTTSKQLPVTNISWYACQEFIKKLNQQTGMRFRLPTEAEWEYAARGGQKSKGYTYAGSNDLKEVAWYNGNSGNTLHAVAQKKPNELGIYDMSGNVWEWCHDWYASYPTTHQYNPLGPEVGQVVGKRYIRMFRGGSYGYAAAYHQNTFRDITSPEPDKGAANLGLRLVLSDEVNFKTIHVNDTLAFHMMDVKGGTFMMGADKAEVNPELAATPVHPVTLSDYYVGETQITQVLWMTIMGTSIRDELEKGGGDYLGEGDDYPMYAISWYDCQEFISKLNQQTGLQFSMPTEAEWEYAARGGQLSRGYQYAGSDNLDEVAWHTGNSKKIGDKVAVSPVKLKKPNELGLYDMTGNIWEWCLDREYLYTPDPQTNPLFSRAGNQLAIIRGGSTYGWGNDSYYVYYRFPYNASTKRTRVGLRLVLHDTVPVSPEPEYVDLGLSVKWATFNVGASKPEDYGDYFAWGETEPKEEYSWATYKWCDGTQNTMTKYCSDSLYDNADYKTTLDPEDDAAIVRLGGNWRMPAKEEWMELKQKCTWERITINGITGYQVTGKNGNSIFLPRAGLRIMKKPHAADSVGYYASSSHVSKYKKENFFYFMRMCDSIITISSGLRYYGYPIRPVYDDRPDPCLVVNVNDTLSFNMMCVEGGTFTMGANNDP